MRLALAAVLALTLTSCATPQTRLASHRRRLLSLAGAARGWEIPHLRAPGSIADLDLYDDRVIFRIKSEKSGELIAFTYGLLNDPPKIVPGADGASVVRIPPWVGERGGLEATYADAAKAEELVAFVQKLRQAAPQE